MTLEYPQTRSRRRKAARIEDVAAVAGVSAMTVSRALRGVDGVSERKRAEILRIATRLNYVPNSNARSLAVANSNLIGISLPTFANDVFADILSGMRGTFENAGFSTVIDTTEYRETTELAWVERLLSWRPAAVILTGIDHHPQVRERLRAGRVPTLEIWGHSEDPIDLCVGIDHAAAGELIGSRMVELGYRAPAFVGAPAGRDTRADLRVTGLNRAFADVAEMPVQELRPALDDASAFEVGFAALNALLETDRALPDVVFFLNDHMAFGGLMACERHGLSVPMDMGLVGFNALPMTRVLPVSLTTVRTPRTQMGIMGAQRLLARIHGVTPPRSTALPVQVIEGGTTRPQA